MRTVGQPLRRLLCGAVAATAMLLLAGRVEPANAQTATITLLVPASQAFAVLGHSCGGIQEQVLATGFDATSGYPTGDVYLQTRCGGSGRGGGYHTTTYSAWLGAIWDYTGALVASEVLATVPTDLDPAFSAVDAFGNHLYNHLNAVNVSPSACTVGNTTYCSYRAYLDLAPSFVPVPRVTGISATSGPVAGGTTVTVTGTGFTGATAVDFGDLPAASFTVVGDGSITAVSPAAGSGGTVDVTVTTAGGTSASTASDRFTFVAAPVVSALSPDNGPLAGGTLVTITGANFIDVVTVEFGDTPVGFTVDDDASITAVSPPGEAVDTVGVRVITVGGTSPAVPAAEFAYTAAPPVGICGDGTVDPGEECDDGGANGQPGDCCTDTCLFQPAGSSCEDDADLCTSDACDGAGGCVHVAEPAAVCTPPDVAAGASLLMRTSGAARNDTQFLWGKGPAVPLDAFGDPGVSDLGLCIYDETAPGTYALAFTGSPSVTGGGTWKSTTTGWKFHSTRGAPDGITGVALTASPLPLKAKVQVRAANSPGFALPSPQYPRLIAQLRSSSGACFGATFSTPTVNGAKEYKAKSD